MLSAATRKILGRRGEIIDMQQSGDYTIVVPRAPVAEIFERAKGLNRNLMMRVIMQRELKYEIRNTTHDLQIVTMTLRALRLCEKFLL